MKLSIFDLDKTLVKANISFKYYFYLCKSSVYKKASVFQQMYFLMQYKYFGDSLKAFHEKVFSRYLKGKNYHDITKYVDIFLDKYLDSIFYMPAVLRFQKAIQENHYIALFSSSPLFLVKPIAEILKIDEYRATLYGVDKSNNFEKIDSIIDGQKKAKYAKALIDRLGVSKENMFVYSDSIEDLKLFEMAENKIAVNPCKRLKKLAKQNSWEII